MTTTQQPVAEGALLVQQPAAPDESIKRQTFQLVAKDDNGDDVLSPPLVAVRPKQAVLLAAAQAVMMGSQPDEVMPGSSQVMAFLSLQDEMFDPDTRAYLQERWDDPDDDLDVDVLEPIFQALVGLWYGRPTGSPAGSPQSRRTAGKSSTARSRSRGKATR